MTDEKPAADAGAMTKPAAAPANKPQAPDMAAATGKPEPLTGGGKANEPAPKKAEG